MSPLYCLNSLFFVTHEDEDFRQSTMRPVSDYANILIDQNSNQAALQEARAQPLAENRNRAAARDSSAQNLMRQDAVMNVLEGALQILRTDPGDTYLICEKIGQGAFGTIFKVKRLDNQKEFALKSVVTKDAIERRKVLDECRLMAYLNCD